MTAFDHALKLILKHEGGYVNHPRLAIVDARCYKAACLIFMKPLRKFALLLLRKAV